MDKRDIHSVAAKARHWLLRFVKRQEGKGCTSVCGFCAIGSAKLYELLVADKRFKDCEINPVIVDYDCEGSHAFVVVSNKEDDLIVDITADQFGMKPIEIRYAHDDDNDWFWGNQEDDDDMQVFSGIKSFKEAVRDWDSQSPLNHGLLQKGARK